MENTEFSAHLTGDMPANSPSKRFLHPRHSARCLLPAHTGSQQPRAGSASQEGKRRSRKVEGPAPSDTHTGAESGLAQEVLAAEGGRGTARSACDVRGYETQSNAGPQDMAPVC